MGEASWQASEILEYLNGQIKRDQLAQELTSTIDGLTSGLDQARAAITAEKTERVDADGALATRVDTTLAVATRRRRRAGIAHGAGGAGWPAQGHLERQGPGHQGRQGLCGRHVAGAYTNPDGRVQSSVYFLADRFGFLSLANGAVTTPFVIENGQTVINDAVIGTGRITNAMVRNLDAEKINAGYLNVDRLNAGSLTAKMATLTDAYIKTANIGIAQVDTLRIASGAVVVNNSVSFSMRIGVYSGITTASVSLR